MFRARVFFFRKTVSVQVWCSVYVHCSSYKTVCPDACIYTLYRTCTYNRHPEDEPSGSKYVADIIN